jgi:hypothetical protein
MILRNTGPQHSGETILLRLNPSDLPLEHIGMAPSTNLSPATFLTLKTLLYEGANGIKSLVTQNVNNF